MSVRDTAVQRRLRAWTRRPTEAIRYGIFARISDWLCAGRDAKAGLAVLLVPIRGGAADELASKPAPDPSSPAPDSWGTPRTLYLSQLGRGRADREWTTFQAEVADLQVALTMARAEQVSALDELARLRAELAEIARPSDDDLKVRLGGETDTDEAVVRERRMAEYAARRTPLETEIRRLQAVVTAKDVEVARLGEPVRIRFQVAQNRADMVEAYVRRRCAAYLTRLVRKHPEGRRIAEVVKPDWPGRPTWSLGDLSPDLRDVPNSQTAGRPATRPASAAGEQPGTQMPTVDGGT